MTPIKDEIGGYFPLTALRSLLFRNENLESATSLSKDTGDTAKVLIIPFSLGAYIKTLDPDEIIFHIELFPTNIPQAELWLSFEWKESNARRRKFREIITLERERKDKHDLRIKEIMADLPSHLGEEWNRHMAELALKEAKNGRFDKVLSIFNIAEKLIRYEEEDKTL